WPTFYILSRRRLQEDLVSTCDSDGSNTMNIDSPARSAPIPVFIGFDSREVVAFSVLSYSIHARASWPVQITPLMISQLGSIYKRPRHHLQSTDFSFSRFLTPSLSGYSG